MPLLTAPFLPLFALCLGVDLGLFYLLTEVAGLGPRSANTLAMLVAGLAVLTLARPRGMARQMAVLGPYLLWLVLAALAVCLLLGFGAGRIGLPLLKGLCAVGYAAVSVMLAIRRPALSGRGMAGMGVGAVALGALTLAPQGSTARDTARDTGADIRAFYDSKRQIPAPPRHVFHLGHSLVGRDMPAMLSQLAGRNHDYRLQLGWGTSLREHFEPTLKINGFEQENATPFYRDAHEALASGTFDAFVMTEMVTLKDAIRYHDSRSYAAKWAAEAAKGNPSGEIFLYESWHNLRDKPEWLARLPEDLEKQWLPDLLFPAARAAQKPVWLIPAGQVMARLVSEAEAAPAGIGEMHSREDLFARTPEGDLDPIHPNDLGNYLVALTHYAVIYGRSPVGLPHQLARADGTPAKAPSPELARRMQETVWEVVRTSPWTGVAQVPQQLQ